VTAADADLPAVTVDANGDRVALVVEREGVAVRLPLAPEEARRVARELATTASQVEPRKIEAGAEADE
jgi:hypothetical protein